MIGAGAFQQHGLSSFPGAWARNHLVLGMAELGNFDKMEKIDHEALEIAEQVENVFTLVMTYSFLGMAYLRLGKVDPALLLLENGHKLCRLSEIPFGYPFAAGSLGYAYPLANEREERGFEAWAMLVMAKIQTAAKQFQEAQQWYQRTLQRASDLSMRPLVAHCHKGLSDCYLGFGNEKKAQ